MKKLKHKHTKALKIDNSYKKLSIITAIIIIVILVGIGVNYILNSHAATPYAAVTASTGVVKSPAFTVPNCAGSINGTCVQFGQTSGGGGGGGGGGGNTVPIAMDGNVALGLSTTATPFAANSFWNTPLPANTPVNNNNTQYQNIIEDNFCNLQTANPSVQTSCPISTFSGGLNVSQFSAPLYVVPANQPLVPVTLSCPGASGHTPNATLIAAVAGGVPIPTDAHAAAGTDQEIQIYQPSTNKYWEFWRFENQGTNKWIACWGGLIPNVSTSDGIFTNDTGATASSIPLLGGVAQISQMQSGQINHVLGLTIGDVASGDLSSGTIPANEPGATSGVSFPATHGDGASTNPLAIPTGTRFRLPASLNLNSLGLTPVGLEIATAAQKYGVVLYDTSPQASLNFRLGDPISYTTAGLPNPYTNGVNVGGKGTTGLFQGVTQGAVLKNFPWQQLQALPFNYAL